MNTREIGKRRSRAVTATVAGLAVIGSGAAGVAAWADANPQPSTTSGSLTSGSSSTTTQNSPVQPSQGGPVMGTSSGS